MERNFKCFIGFTNKTNREKFKKCNKILCGFLISYFHGNLEDHTFKANSFEELLVYLKPFMEFIDYLKMIDVATSEERELIPLKSKEEKVIYLVNPLKKGSLPIFPNP